MNLKDYREQWKAAKTGRTDRQFAIWLGFKRQNVEQWLEGHIPRPCFIAAITIKTAGEVSVVDFYPVAKRRRK